MARSLQASICAEVSIEHITFEGGSLDGQRSEFEEGSIGLVFDVDPVTGIPRGRYVRTDGTHVIDGIEHAVWRVSVRGS